MVKDLATYPVSLSDVITASVEPQVGVAVPCGVLLAVVQHALENVWDGAVVAATVAGSQDDNVSISWRTSIALPAVCVLGNAPVPLWLGLEVSRLGGVVVGDNWRYRLSGRIIPVVLDWDIAVEAEEHDEDGDGGDGEYDGPTGSAG